MHFSMARWFLAACMGAIIDLTTGGLLEVDLVFPRNETYPSDENMPIVFAFQHPENARYIQPFISYKVFYLNEHGGPNNFLYTHYDLAWADWTTVPNPYFVYKHWNKFNGKEGRWRLVWSLETIHCSEDSFVNFSSPGLSYNVTSGYVEFTTEKSAPEIDLVASTANMSNCKEAGVVVDVGEKTLDVPAYVEWRGDRNAAKKCAVMAPPTADPIEEPATDPCRVKIDSAIAQNIAASASSKAEQCNWLNPPPDCP
ncbi:hypothetical protein AJ79_10116 [Helicocarpus griseus UAMH5409]|uniref:DUF7136 domain-containing protein n=1 Tax=Helicocarpus griseus UAMH5409 TaxID=1447875 RepID=A0A2B7WFE5_9EURO|nr:hypothetical protein AJ79_10116 [Helicocarpus griseus UAMH5409]